jgi:hypothetical protein
VAEVGLHAGGGLSLDNAGLWLWAPAFAGATRYFR